jgi:hypothetical protein
MNLIICKDVGTKRLMVTLLTLQKEKGISNSIGKLLMPYN